MQNAFIIQARLTSTRLPRKVLLPFVESRTILQVLTDRLSSFPDWQTIIATSEDKRNDELISWAGQHQIAYFRGSEDDVLKRFIDTAEQFGIRNIIRICSDNPFLSRQALEELITAANNAEADYISFKVADKPSILTHYGFWAEYVTLDALKRVAAETADLKYREHVTNYIYTHPDKFSIRWIPVSEQISSIKNVRLTIDTIDDFRTAQEIASRLTTEASMSQIISFLQQNSCLVDEMEKQIKKNEK